MSEPYNLTSLTILILHSKNKKITSKTEKNVSWRDFSVWLTPKYPMNSARKRKKKVLKWQKRDTALVATVVDCRTEN
jgi:deoxyribodipyrimidine photolyase